MLRAKVRDEDRHQRLQLIHGELIPERVHELQAVRANEGPRIYIIRLKRPPPPTHVGKVKTCNSAGGISRVSGFIA